MLVPNDNMPTIHYWPPSPPPTKPPIPWNIRPTSTTNSALPLLATTPAVPATASPPTPDLVPVLRANEILELVDQIRSILLCIEAALIQAGGAL